MIKSDPDTTRATFKKYFNCSKTMPFLRIPVTRLSTISRTSRASIQPLAQAKYFSNTVFNMANTPTSNIISETAKQEGGPTQGSTSAQMQSQVGKERNFEQAAQEVGSKMQNAPETITSEVGKVIKFNKEDESTDILQRTPPTSSLVRLVPSARASPHQTQSHQTLSVSLPATRVPPSLPHPRVPPTRFPRARLTALPTSRRRQRILSPRWLPTPSQ